MARLTAATADPIERTLLTTMARGATNGAPQGLATVPDAAVEASQTDDGRNVLRQGHLDNSRAVKEPWKAIVLRAADGVDFAKGTQRGTQGVIRNFTRKVANVDQTGLLLHGGDANAVAVELKTAKEEVVTGGHILES